MTRDDEAWIESQLEQIAYETQMIVDAEERERRAKRLHLPGDLGQVDAATDDDGLPNLNPVMRDWIEDSERGE